MIYICLFLDRILKSDDQNKPKCSKSATSTRELPVEQNSAKDSAIYPVGFSLKKTPFKVNNLKRERKLQYHPIKD